MVPGWLRLPGFRQVRAAPLPTAVGSTVGGANRQRLYFIAGISLHQLCPDPVLGGVQQGGGKRAVVNAVAAVV